MEILILNNIANLFKTNNTVLDLFLLIFMPLIGIKILQSLDFMKIFKFIKKIVFMIFRIKIFEITIQCDYSFDRTWVRDDDCHLVEMLYESIIEFLKRK